MPTQQLRDYLTRLRRDAVSLVPCRHPECAAYRSSLAERIGIVRRLIGEAEKRKNSNPLSTVGEWGSPDRRA